MLKNIGLFLAVTLLLSACGSDDDKKSTTSSSSSVSSSTATSASTAMSSSTATSASTAMSSSVSSSEASSSSSESSSEASSSQSSSSVDNSILAINFELDSVASTYATVGWAPTDAVATVIAISSVTGLPANGGSTNVLRATIGNYNAAPKFSFILPDGKTLADYELKVDAYFPRNTLGLTDEADNYYKEFMFLAGTTLSNELSLTNTAYQAKIDTIFDDVDAWKTYTFTPDATKGAAITGALEISIGLNRPAGTDADAYYFDNLRLELAD
jgi:uncharacterized protein YceK